MVLLAEKQLGQVRPADTANTVLYTNPASTRAVMASLYICNTTNTRRKFRVFHDQDGAVTDESTALFFDATIEGNQTVIFDGFAAQEPSSIGTVTVRSDLANALTFTLNGAEIS